MPSLLRRLFIKNEEHIKRRRDDKPLCVFFSPAEQDIIKTIFFFNAQIKQCGKNTGEVLEAISILSLFDIKCV